MATTEDCPPSEAYLIRPHGTGDTGTSPEKWISWRFTTPYEQRISELFANVSYIAAHETSAKGVEHWHVLSIGHDHYDRIKKTIQRKLNMTGMLWWSKKNHKTFAGGLSYTLKCIDNDIGSKRVLKSPDWIDYEYTKWVFHDQPTLASTVSKDTKKDRDWQLTYSNLVTQAMHYHRSAGLPNEVGLKETVRQMMEATKWRPSAWMLREGVPEFYVEDFEFRKGKRPKISMDWFVAKQR